MAATLMAVNDLMRSESPVRRQPDKLVQVRENLNPGPRCEAHGFYRP